jgi:integrase
MRSRGRRNTNRDLRSSCDIVPDWHLAARAHPYRAFEKKSSSEPRQRVHVDGTLPISRRCRPDRQAFLGVRLHDLRHSRILQLLGAGVPVHAVSERAGHKNAYVNLAIYAHTLGGMQWQAVEELDAALRPHLRQAGPPGCDG